jgi:hypothetical protein
VVAHGRPVPAGEVLVPGPVALAAAGRLVAVAEGRSGALRPSVVLVTPGEAA